MHSNINVELNDSAAVLYSLLIIYTKVLKLFTEKEILTLAFTLTLPLKSSIFPPRCMYFFSVSSPSSHWLSLSSFRYFAIPGRSQYWLSYCLLWVGEFILTVHLYLSIYINIYIQHAWKLQTVFAIINITALFYVYYPTKIS